MAQATLSIAFEALRFAANSADVFPPLKTGAAGALHIIQLIQGFSNNQNAWRSFGTYVESNIGIIARTFSKNAVLSDDIKDRLIQLQRTLEEIQSKIESLQRLSRKRRIVAFLKDREKIVELKQQLKEKLDLFHLEGAINVEVAVDRKVPNLPYAEAASWSKAKGCLSGTRVTILDDAFGRMTRAADDVDQRPVLEVLESVAGGGKTAFTHSLAARCYDEGCLGSAFFFDREQPERSKLVFITIAQDLAARDPRMRAHSQHALEQEPGLVTASLDHQFRKLVLEPCQLFPPQDNRVILIDALDESFDDDDMQLDAFFAVLRDEVPKLPPFFRFFVTSRNSTHLRRLKKASHVHSRSINILDKNNLDDIAVYVRHELKRVAASSDYDSSWPGQNVTEQLIKKAEGHFQWVATVANFLTNTKTFDPDPKLQTLLSQTNEALPPERKMDKLYAHILSGYDWNDAALVESYQLLMGSLLTLRAPLSASAIQSLHSRVYPHFKVKPIADLISPLLTGWPDASTPIQILHQSLRDFLTNRAQNEPEWRKFYISEKDHDAQLAVLTLSSLNEDLSTDLPCAGFLARIDDESLGIPEMMEDDVPEDVLYSCRFWTTHIIGVDNPGDEFTRLLRQFLSSKLVLWMEVTSCTGTFQPLSGVREWIKMKITDDGDISADLCVRAVAVSLFNLSLCLRHMGRREDALRSAEEAVVLSRALASHLSEETEGELAQSLDNLSVCFHGVGRLEEALGIAMEGIDIRRRLAITNPDTFRSRLANSLNILSICLDSLGRPEEALQAIEEAVALHRELARERPAAFNAGLAASLNNLSDRLDKVRRREEGLRACEEAVALYRQLASERPAAFNADLAVSLYNLSIFSDCLGQNEAAVIACEESLALYQELAEERPAIFNSDVTDCLERLKEIRG